MAHADSVRRQAACVERLVHLLPTLVTPADTVAVAWGGCLSPCNTVLCAQELRTRMHQLGLADLHHRPCRVDVAVALFSIASKYHRSENAGFLDQDAWRIALEQRAQVWAVYVHSARDAGPPTHLAVLDVAMRANWLSDIEASLLTTLGRGLWDVERPKAVKEVLHCVSQHLDLEACADERGMLEAQTVEMYFVWLTGAVLQAAYQFLETRASVQADLLELARAWLKTLDTFAKAYYQGFSEPVHMHDLGLLNGQIGALVHAGVLLCEYVLLCAEAAAKLAGAGEPLPGPPLSSS